MRPDRTACLTAHDGPLFTEIGLLTTININKFTKHPLLLSFINVFVLNKKVHHHNALIDNMKNSV